MIRSLLVYSLIAGHLFAASLTSRISPGEVRIGEEITLSVQVAGAASKSIHAVLPEEGEFVLLRIDSAAYAKDGTLGFVFAAYDTGRYSLPEIPIVIGSGAAAETLKTSSQNVHVKSILPDSAAAIRAIKPYREQRFRLRELYAYWWVLAILGAAALGWWIWKKYFRKRAADEILSAVPLLPPYEEAMRDLISLKDQQYPRRGMMKEHFSEFSHILRNYLERRYGFPALEMTTFELEYEFEESRYPTDLRKRLLPALRESDLVKFAKHVPDEFRADECVDLGFELLKLTKPAEVHVEQAEEVSP